VAKKLGREFLGTELSADYAKYATQRLKGIKSGDPLDGPADPASSSPNTASGVTLEARNRRKAAAK
jgi:site-specific DNA-methyltransferase (adenine-specific)